MPRTSRVFISYSQDSPEHMTRVLRLATRLVTEGIDAQLDQWNEDPTGDWPFWMERQVSASNFVIVVCTETYRRRLEHPEEGEGGKGAFWEGNLIRKKIYESKGGNRRFIPVFCGASGLNVIPEMLQGSTYYQVDSPRGYKALYRRISDQPEILRPELGILVVLPRKSVLTAKAKKATLPRTRSQPVRCTTLQGTRSPATCEEKLLRSVDGFVSTYIRFDNYLTEDVNLYWLNYEGERVYYATLQAGRSHVQQTYVPHPWVVTKKDVYSGKGKCLVIFEPTRDPGIAEIK